MDTKTLTYTLISILGFGIWGLLMKVGQQRLGTLPNLTVMGAAVAVVMVVGLTSRTLPFPGWNLDLWVPIAATLATMVAMLTLSLALGSSPGSTAAVVALSALYPGVTAILATIFLGEAFSPAKIAGLCLAVGAAFLFTR